MRLYNYWRSSTAYRVRIALNLKGIPYEVHSVSLVAGGGENHRPEYLAVNPQGRVPTLVLEDGTHLMQSPAILEYLEEVHPTPRLLPEDARRRAQVRAMCAIVACDVHPLNNVRTLRALRDLGATDAGVQSWYARWIQEGFEVIEGLVGREGLCIGTEPTLADVCLIPQIYNARRFNVPLTPYPNLLSIEAHCMALESFALAAPEAQPDAIR